MYLRPTGYSVVTDGWGVEKREDTRKCWHCQHILFISAGQDPNEFFCRMCMQAICRDCVGKPCDHWEKKLDREEVTGRWLWERFGEKLERASTENQIREIDAAIERARFLRDAGIG